MALQNNNGRRRLDVMPLEDRTVPAVFGIGDASFESPILLAGNFRYAPTGTPWTFSAGAGVTTNNSGFSSGNPGAPQGSQALFLQGTGTATQSAVLPAGTYELNFMAAQRGNKASVQTFRVLIDGNVVGSFNTVSGPGYSRYSTSSFTVGEGTHTITFQGTNIYEGDNTVFIDQLDVVSQFSGLDDSGFESPALNPGTFQYNPSGTPWTFTQGAGVATNASGFLIGSPASPQGDQVAVLQKLASMSEVVEFVAGTYAINFTAMQRMNMPSAQTFQVLIDGNVVGTFNNLAGTAYTLQTTSSFNVTSGNHTVTFKGTNLNGGDNTVFIDNVSIVPVATDLVDSGFESPALAAGTFAYNPTGTPWTFTGGAGVATNGSGFTANNPVAPQGSQVVFVQKQGSAAQTLTLAAGTYDVSFRAAQRGMLSSAQTFQVLVDGEVVGTFNTLTGASYVPLATSSFSVAEGDHTVEIRGTNLFGGDNTIFIDDVSVNPLPNAVADSSFESPALTPGTFQYNPAGTKWTHTGTSGVAANGSAFTSGNPPAPQGNQVLLLQRLGTASQTRIFDSGVYSINFSAAQRGNQSSAQTFRVLVDGIAVGEYLGLTGTGYTALSTRSFFMTAGEHTIQFKGTNLNGGDNTVFIDQIALTEQASNLNDAGFETPALSIGSFRYRPVDAVWTFTGSAGVSNNGSAFTSGNPASPVGSQVAVLQNTGSIKQTASFTEGTYTLSFLAAQRGNQASAQTFKVLLDGTEVATFNNLLGSGYTLLTTPSFAVTEGTHTLTIQGTNLYGGDNAVFIDNVQFGAG